MHFASQKLALGLCGGIAAYKGCDLLRECKRRGIEQVFPVLSANAEAFVSPLTLHALAGQPALKEALSVDEQGVPWHIRLAQEADALLVIAATANCLAKMAAGLSDDLLSTTLLTFTDKPVILAPAMNTRMWNNPVTQRNIAFLKTLPHVSFVEPGAGLLACGETGDGHLASQELILQELYRRLHPDTGLYKGIKALVTAGGTSEPLDPVREISNRSSGKMGLALADELHAMGAEVTLISTKPLPGDRAYSYTLVKTVASMREAVLDRANQQQLLIKAAAVSDYKPVYLAAEKIKKQESTLSLTLERTHDILAELGQCKPSGQFLMGFAAETHNGLEYALDKMRRKNLDAIALNDVSRADTGMEANDNEITLLFPDGKSFFLPKQSKTSIARALLQALRPKLI